MTVTISPYTTGKSNFGKSIYSASSLDAVDTFYKKLFLVSHTLFFNLCNYTLWIFSICLKTILSNHSTWRISPQSYRLTSYQVVSYIMIHAFVIVCTFSNLFMSLSSCSFILLGVAVSWFPSASTSGQICNLCFPFRNVLYIYESISNVEFVKKIEGMLTIVFQINAR
jgi:hypothetical protein